jgi:hypothetical protein
MRRHRENPPDLQESTRAQFLRVLGELFFYLASVSQIHMTEGVRRSRPHLLFLQNKSPNSKGKDSLSTGKEVVTKSKLSSFL